MLLSLSVLQLIWWSILGCIVYAFVITEGINFGVAIISPFTHSKERLLQYIEPVWENHQVWLILGSAGTFAAWPLLYATIFSFLYIPICVFVFCLILRPVSLKLRHLQCTRAWDFAFFISGMLPSWILGVCLYHVYHGLPFHYDTDLRLHTEVTDIFSVHAILWGIGTITFCAAYSCLFALKKGINSVYTATMVLVLCTIALFVYMFWPTVDYKVFIFTQDINVVMPPFSKAYSGTHIREWALYIYLGGSVSFVISLLALIARNYRTSISTFCAGSLCYVSYGAVARFPIIMPSSTHPSHSLSLWDASSGQKTLTIMFYGTVVLLPTILWYTRWLYNVFKER